MMGQQQQETVAALRRIMLVVLVAAFMAVLMAASATSAFAGPKDHSAAGQCTPNPGDDTKFIAKHPGSTVEVNTRPPGQGVREACAPGQ